MILWRMMMNRLKHLLLPFRESGQVKRRVRMEKVKMVILQAIIIRQSKMIIKMMVLNQIKIVFK